ncbi:hypothetical protein BDN67DRAFT_900489, partial [Paxillus ammoniavirescens]
PGKAAALMKGRIITQLAHNALGDHMRIALCDGPTEDILNYGTAIQLGGDHYWDNKLSADEEQIICGMHKISTSQCEPNAHGQQSTGWPKQSMWEGCSLSVGYWSSDDKAWFQKWLDTIHNYSGDGPSPCLNSGIIPQGDEESGGH